MNFYIKKKKNSIRQEKITIRTKKNVLLKKIIKISFKVAFQCCYTQSCHKTFGQ